MLLSPRFCQDTNQIEKKKRAQFRSFLSPFVHISLLHHSSHSSRLYLFGMAASNPPSSTGSTKLDGVVQNASANTPEKLSGVALYSRFALAGAICCSVTHGGLTPVDV